MSTEDLRLIEIENHIRATILKTNFFIREFGIRDKLVRDYIDSAKSSLETAFKKIQELRGKM